MRPDSRIPGAVERLGPSAFVTMDAWPMDPKRASVLYVKKELLELIPGQTATTDQTVTFVEDNLLLTFDSKNAIPGMVPVKVHVDRQDDPMKMSLNGNLGSGRAVYVGDRFNIKGLGKTVLATSTDPNHSNGNLDLVSALWEMICSNALLTNLRTGTCPTLAVVDLNKSIFVPWRKEEVPGGLLIRMDSHGELDRPTHLFQTKKPVSADRMRHLARRMGVQGAEKFIERIIHGCWSAGNISLDGHLIDYDTVFALRGRAPQWSYRPNWLSDFFGLEGPGQKKLLKALANDPLNADRVSLRTLNRDFDNARRIQLERRFPDLIGANPDELRALAPDQQTAISALAHQFQVLSMKMYPNFKATAAWDEDNTCLSVYDLSRFFRFYPIMRRSGKVDEDAALELIRNPQGKLVFTEGTEDGGIPDNVRSALMKDYVISSPAMAAAMDKQALVFIREYDKLLSEIERTIPESPGALIARAYVVNEERTYMNSRPGNDILVALVQNYKSGKITPGQFSELLHLIVESNDRIPHFDSSGSCQADLRLFLDGYTSSLVDSEGSFQPRLSFLRAKSIPETGGSWELEAGGKKYACSCISKDGQFHVTGPKFPLIQLVPNSEHFRFFHQGKPVNLQQIRRE